ncbi:hypothetical protein Awo_c17060 [Acetobacterium woodii DSM 1030]|uniref:Uncharacterized protein n=1 Tax=Acetobacterium woodii (strain ATCC 29683 / DSM 1030 / JCM 2381 / KCTC 1655 / WB1) TaxID=931626 RepID=H6LHV6_ACEWD|nr:hypothetical protein Awo_c17060 [Acetobacterium woodii DSM 1030]
MAPILLELFYVALSLPHRNIAINDHRVGRWDNAVKNRINQSTAAQAFMPTFGSKLRTENRGRLATTGFHQLQQITLSGICSRDKQKLIQDHQGTFSELIKC